MFLLNGGEETFSQGADGFMQQGAWRSPLGAFLNLESTGSGGPAVAFQVTGNAQSSVPVQLLAAHDPACSLLDICCGAAS